MQFVLILLFAVVVISNGILTDDNDNDDID